MNLCPYNVAWEEPPKRSHKKSHKTIKVPPPPEKEEEGFTQTAPDPQVLAGPPASVFQPESVAPEGLFPLPGETGTDEEWSKVFSLGAPAAMVQRTTVNPDGSVPVDGKPNQWRHISAPPVPPPTWIVTQNPPPPAATTIPPAIPMDIAKRLDQLTSQLDSLTTPQTFQGTAELFLFVAIGLLLLLAIDMILRVAVSVATTVIPKQPRLPRWRGYGRLF